MTRVCVCVFARDVSVYFIKSKLIDFSFLLLLCRRRRRRHIYEYPMTAVEPMWD